LLTTIDPWYRAAARRVGWLESGILGLALFGSLCVALPLLGIPVGWALPLSGAGSVLALSPVVWRAARDLRRGAVAALAVGAVALALVLSRGVAWFPPVPMHLARVTFARAVLDLEPIEPVFRIPLSELRANGGVLAFSAVVAPAGLRDGIQHVWRKDGKVVDRIALAVRGGRPAGFRTFSRKADLGPTPLGSWAVDVLTTSGQLLGRARLTVTPDPVMPPEPVRPAPIF
jgi:hypothetical protein